MKPVAPTPAPPPPSSSSSTSSTIVAPKPLFSFGTPATATKPVSSFYLYLFRYQFWFRKKIVLQMYLQARPHHCARNMLCQEENHSRVPIKKSRTSFLNIFLQLFGAPSTTPSTTPFSFSTPKPAISEFICDFAFLREAWNGVFSDCSCNHENGGKI